MQSERTLQAVIHDLQNGATKTLDQTDKITFVENGDYLIRSRANGQISLIRLSDFSEAGLWLSAALAKPDLNASFSAPDAAIPTLNIMVESNLIEISNFKIDCDATGRNPLRLTFERARAAIESRNKISALAELAQLFRHDTLAYLQLTSEYPAFFQDLELSKIHQIGLQSRDLDALKPRVKSLMKLISQASYNNQEWLSAEVLRGLAPVTSQFSFPEYEVFVDNLSLKKANQASLDPRAAGLSKNKISGITETYVLDLIGRSEGETSDLTLARFARNFIPTIISSEPILDRPYVRLPFGAFISALGNVPVTNGPEGTPLVDKTFTWRTGPHRYASTLTVTREAPPMIARKTAPDYQRMTADGHLEGAILFGHNLPDNEPTWRQYIKFFRSKGYRFDPVGTLDDVKGWLKNKVATGQLDYLVKEAHADSVETILFMMQTRARMLTGYRNNGSVREEIHLIRGDKAELFNIETEEFSAWLKTRLSASQPELVYLNGSCWSYTKALNELEKSDSRILTNIAALTMVSTFENHRLNAMYHILNGLLEKHTFSQMRQGLSQVPDYSKHQDEVFIFPDEQQYEESIWSLMTQPLQIRIQTQFH